MNICVLYRDHRYWMYVMLDLPLDTVAGVLVWRVLSQGGYRFMWRVILLCWPRSIVGWVHWPSVHRLVSFFYWSVVTYNDSLQFTFFPLLHGFNNCMFCSGVPYLYLLFRMCNVYAEIRLFVLIHLCVHGELKWTKYYFVWSEY